MNKENIIKMMNNGIKHFSYSFIKSLTNIIVTNPNRSTIYLLVITEHSLLLQILIYYLIDDYNVKIINNLDNINHNDIIIPVCVKAQALLYKDKIYSTLDNKKSFYNLLGNYSNCLKHIHLIPSYDKNYKGDNIFKNFLLKPVNDWGSKNILFKEGFIYDIISKYAKTHQIQDIIKLKAIYEANFVCKDGVIINNIMCITNESILTQNYLDSIDNTKNIPKYILITKNIPKYILKLCKTVIASLNYNGFIEFEFIKDVNGKFYIMECNPRISGTIYNPLYFKELVEPYFYIKSTFANYLVKSYEYKYEKKVKYNSYLNLQKYLKFKLKI